MRITASIHRRPTFYLVNVALPASVLSLMSLITFCIPQEAVSDRLGYSSTLALTIISAKFATSSAMPAISYLTLLDRFQLACIGIIFLIVGEASVFAILHEATAARAERLLLCATVLLWLGVQARFAYALCWHAWRHGREPAQQAPLQPGGAALAAGAAATSSSSRRHVAALAVVVAAMAAAIVAVPTAVRAPQLALGAVAVARDDAAILPEFHVDPSQLHDLESS